MIDYYKILGIKPDATREQVKSAWHRLARKYHPDLHPEDSNAEEQFKRVSEAYEVLYDEGKRSVYDLTGGTVFYTNIVEKPPVNHYFYARADQHAISLNEELEITFTYSGEGRIFVKPSFDEFFMSGPPFVSFRKLIHEEHKIRETTLTYIIAPVKTGVFEIGKASIKIDGKKFYSEPLKINVTPNNCYFLNKHIADGPPLHFPMNFEYQIPGNKLKLRGNNPGHTILIPRCKTAFIFHTIGAAIKICCTLAGMIYLHRLMDIHYLVGAAAGSFFGGLNCQLMYRLVGIRSKYKYAVEYPLVKEYAERGYLYGSSSGTQMVSSSFIYKFTRLIT